MRAGASAEVRARIEVERVAGDDLEPAGIALGDLGERGDGAVVALDRDHAPRAGGEERAGQPAGAGSDLDHVDARERAGGARDAGGEIEIEQEILAERFLGGEAVPADHLAQRRQVVDRAHARRATGRGSEWAARRAAKLQRGDQACRIGASGAGDVEGGAVIGRGAHERQPERDIDRVVEGQRLDRDQRLVVIHRERHVVARARGGVKQRIGRQRAARIDAVGAQALDRGRDDGDILLAERAVLAGMRVETGHHQPRPRDAEAARAGRAPRSGRSRRSGRW